MLRRREAIGALVAGTLALPRSAFGAEPAAVRVATIPSDAGSEPFYGLDMGFFAKAGLNVTLDTQQSGPAIASAVAGGALDIGFSNVMSIAAAHKHGLPFTFVAPGSLYLTAAPTSGLVVRQDSALRTARDLNGKTIGVNGLKNIAQYAPMAWVDQNGGDSSTLRFVEIPGDQMQAALESNRLDLAMMPEPQISQSRTSCRTFAKVYDAVGEGFMIGGWFASAKWADANPDVVRRFAAALHDTAQWANRNQDKSLPILIKYIKLDPETAQKIVRARFAETLAAPIVQPSIDVLARYKGIDSAFRAQELIYAAKR